MYINLNDDDELYFEPHKPGDKIEWATNNIETFAFRFVGSDHVYYLYRDYEKLSPEQKEIFDKENPFWADFFNPNKNK